MYYFSNLTLLTRVVTNISLNFVLRQNYSKISRYVNTVLRNINTGNQQKWILHETSIKNYYITHKDMLHSLETRDDHFGKDDL